MQDSKKDFTCSFEQLPTISRRAAMRGMVAGSVLCVAGVSGNGARASTDQAPPTAEDRLAAEDASGKIAALRGDLVFGGGANDRKFDAKTGKMLWDFPTNSGVTGAPSTFEIDGEQYVAVQSGWGVDAQRMQGAFDTVLPHKTVVPQGGAIRVFKLPKQS